MVVGKVGSGKSTLLQAILGEVHVLNNLTISLQQLLSLWCHQVEMVNGSMSAGGSKAYCAQQPWIMSGAAAWPKPALAGTVTLHAINTQARSRIISCLGWLSFHRSMTMSFKVCWLGPRLGLVRATLTRTCVLRFCASFFTHAHAACGLKQDLNRFVQGSDTLVGERGSTLSGGQRARIGLARSLYANAGQHSPPALCFCLPALCLYPLLCLQAPSFWTTLWLGWTPPLLVR